MPERVCPGQTQQLHHFVSTSSWSTAPLEQVLRKTADALVGGKDAVLIVDDTALPKQGKHSVGVKRQHCGVLGKQANSARGLLPCGCALLTAPWYHMGSIFLARPHGRCAKRAPAASARITSLTTRLTRRAGHWYAQSRPAGHANKRISNSRMNLAWTITRADPGWGYTIMRY